MPRPEFISDIQISEWNKIIDEDNILPKSMSSSSVIREVCYAGMWLSDELASLGCPQELIIRIQFTAGKMSFGRDPWEVSQMMYDKYKKNELIIEPEIDSLSN